MEITAAIRNLIYSTNLHLSICPWFSSSGRQWKAAIGLEAYTGNAQEEEDNIFGVKHLAVWRNSSSLKITSSDVVRDAAPPPPISSLCAADRLLLGLDWNTQRYVLHLSVKWNTARLLCILLICSGWLEFHLELQSCFSVFIYINKTEVWNIRSPQARCCYVAAVC